MPLPASTTWPIEPHTKAKHDILQRYLEAWFPILGKHHRKLVYIDGFCGPGRYAGGEPGSPIIALNVAAEHRPELKGPLLFWFIDERKDRIEQLEQELKRVSLPDNFRIACDCGLFHDTIRPVLQALDQKGVAPAPIFAFIDPFGFKGIPFSVLKQLLSHKRCEVFISFMVEPINRWLTHPQEGVLQHIEEAFGTEECFAIAHKGGDRIRNLQVLYQRQLQSVARFVRYFEIQKRDGHPFYYLFFATNHRLGHLRMKEAMWKVDPNGEFAFSDATDPNQMVLFGQDAGPLGNVLRSEFEAKGKLGVAQIKKYVEEETGYLAKHMRAALAKQESERIINVEEIKADGKKRRKGTFPDDVMLTYV